MTTDLKIPTNLDHRERPAKRPEYKTRRVKVMPKETADRFTPSLGLSEIGDPTSNDSKKLRLEAANSLLEELFDQGVRYPNKDATREQLFDWIAEQGAFLELLRKVVLENLSVQNLLLEA